MSEGLGIDSWINQVFAPVAEASFSIIFAQVPLGAGHSAPIVLIWLVAASVFFTIWLGGINLRGLPHTIRILRGREDDSAQGGPGQISRLQALATKLSGSVGLGNIAGVAVAVSVGGPGAVPWMMLMGIVAMSTMFCEAVMGLAYRHYAPDGRVAGGPMYYLHKGFAKRNRPRLGLGLGIFFAIMCIGASFGAGNMFQANQAYSQVVNVTGGPDGFFGDKGWLFGLILAAMVGSVVLGGIKSIAAAASRIVPIMGGVYVVAALIVIGLHAENIPGAVTTMFSQAFTLEAGIGGLLGALIQGVQRASFSNEAGFGSAGIAHSAVHVHEPVSQGYIAMLGPLIDTTFICAVTGLMIVITGAYAGYEEGMAGVELTSQAFASGIAWFPYILALTVFLFAFSTMISWSYYGAKATEFLFNDSRLADKIYKGLYLIAVVIGAAAELNKVILFTDAMIFAMSIPNIIGLYYLAGEIRTRLQNYRKTHVLPKSRN